MQHSPQFLQLVAEVSPYIQEISWDEYFKLQAQHPDSVLIDVRENHEWQRGHVPHAKHLARGIIERDIQAQVPEFSTPLALYCGGGFRSALSAYNLQKMGYQQVYSIAGGYRAFKNLITARAGNLNRNQVE